MIEVLSNIINYSWNHTIRALSREISGGISSRIPPEREERLLVVGQGITDPAAVMIPNDVGNCRIIIPFRRGVSVR